MVVTEKCDVYSFGVVALETIMGRHPRDLLSSLMLPPSENMMIIDVLDPRLPVPTNPMIAGDIVLIATMALACIRPEPKSRPTMLRLSQEFLSRRKALASPLRTVSLLQLWNRNMNYVQLLNEAITAQACITSPSEREPCKGDIDEGTLFSFLCTIALLKELSHLLWQVLHVIDSQRVWSKLKRCKTRNLHYGARTHGPWPLCSWGRLPREDRLPKGTTKMKLGFT
ncbi:hypothetical protein RHSIM_Rhsim10G0042000 [Rhododendron simsii]|uniref:non-specific serine/threonine protein kinase n=1 Tax=Rhododendron simsii TaxID=118357 RepID=A0A834G919_RHOSS|nr:hypothetical protein RHSIM_Rhsim10G0042000 [Rhododendron simsii]